MYIDPQHFLTFPEEILLIKVKMQVLTCHVLLCVGKDRQAEVIRCIESFGDKIS